jgi:hypothetical protein
MRRHEIDLVSLLTGLVLIGVATLYLFDVHTDVRWILPAVLVTAGLAGVVGTVGLGRGRGSRSDDASDGTAEDGGQGSWTSPVQ